MDLQSFVAQGDPNGQQENLRQPGSQPKISAPPASTNVAAKNPLQFLGNIGRDLGGLVKGVPNLIGQYGSAIASDLKTNTSPFSQNDKLVNLFNSNVKGIVQNYSDIIHHPVQQTLAHPLNTFLALLPAADIGKAAIGGEAATTAEAATAGEAGDTATAATRAVPEQQGLGTRLRTGVGGTAPQDLPGNAAFNLEESNRLSALENDMGLRGSTSSKIQQLNPKITEQVNAVDNAASAHPGFPFNTDTLKSDIAKSVTDPMSPSKAADVYNTMKGQPESAQVSNALDKVEGMIDQKGGIDANLSMQDMHTLRQTLRGMVNGKVWSGVADPNPAELTYMHTYYELGQKMGEANPALRDMISKESDMIKLGKQYGQDASGGGMSRGRVHAPGSPLSLPVSLKGATETATDAIGRAIQNITGNKPAPYAPTTAADAGVGAASAGSPVAGVVGGAIKALPAAAQPVIGQEAQQTDQAHAQGIAANEANPVDFTKPADDVAKALQQAHNDPRANPTGYSVQDLQGMIAQDIATTGGKNYTDLNRLLGIAKAANPGLTSGAVTKITAYNGALTSLEQVNRAFQSGDPSKISNAISQETPAIAKAFGLSPTNKGDIAQLNAMLPTPGDDAYTAEQKLLQIKQALDARASSDVNSEQSKNNAVDTLVGNLTGAGATTP